MSDSVVLEADDEGSPSRCHACRHFMSNQYRTDFHFYVELGDLQESATTSECVECALVLQALELFELNPANLDPDERVLIFAEAGTPFYIRWSVGWHIEIFSINGGGSHVLDLEAFGIGSFIASSITPSLAAKMARNWLNVCRSTHEVCRPMVLPNEAGEAHGYIKPILPRRLIRVGSKGETPRLVESAVEQEEAGAGCKTTLDYIALSYCWGFSQTLLTTKDTLADRMRGIPWDNIPRTIREALEFTRELGEMYIWIDALCIIQDDHDDWLTEAAKMKDVYENALLTLSAASAPDTETGCFLPRPQSNQVYELGTVPPNGRKYYVRRSASATHAIFDAGYEIGARKCPAMTRGWIYQERLLSTRMLYCAQDELVWECKGAVSCECHVGCFLTDTNSGNHITNFKRHRTLEALREAKSRQEESAASQAEAEAEADAMELWLRLLEDYSKRAFTRYTDRLVAIQGIAQKFERLGLGSYNAGIWTSFVGQQLAWVRTSMSTRIRESVARVPNAPTWSWYSTNQPFSFPRPHQITSRFSLLCTSSDSDPATTGHHGPRLRLTVSAPAVAGRLVLKSNQFPPSEAELPSNYKSKGIDFYERKSPEAQAVFITIPGSGAEEYRMMPDICQWSTSSPLFSQMEPSEVLHDGDDVLCVELYQTADIDLEGVNGDIPGRKFYLFPWLVLKRDSPSAAVTCASENMCYRRIGIMFFVRSLIWWMNTSNPIPFMSQSEMKVIDLV